MTTKNHKRVNFTKEWNRANENHNSWEGDYGFTQNQWNAGGVAPAPAPAAPAIGLIEPSRPYQFSFDNTTGAALTNPILLDPKNMSSTNNGTNAAVTVVYQSGSAYNLASFLQRLNNGLIMWVELLDITCATASQITQPITLTYDDIDGSGNYFTLYPKVSENAQQTTVKQFPCGFFMSSNMKFQVASLDNTSVLYLSFYAARVTDQVAQFIGKNGVKGFKAPQIGAPVEMVVKK